MMKHILLSLALSVTFLSFSQNSIPFEEEVKDIIRQNDSLWDSSRNTIVFTGSSSIRLWRDLQDRFPKHQIINSGFGGSQASDLLYHLNDLVIRYRPKKVFIYEGDNDIFSKKRPRDIIETTSQILKRLKAVNPNPTVILISAKPSISRWKLRGKYKRLNKKLIKLAQGDDQVKFVDVWTPMLNGRKVREDIFIGDGLHMNQVGYDIWYETLKDHIN